MKYPKPEHLRAIKRLATFMRRLDFSFLSIHFLSLHTHINGMENLNGLGLEEAWDRSPPELKRYKCNNCKIITWETPCPKCGSSHIDKMCPADHCHCSHDVIEKIEFCKVCGEPACPECNTHDIVAISRITGYLSDVSGWRASKIAELKDRKRYDV